MEPARLLLIEDDRGVAESLIPILVDEGFHVTHELRGDEGLQRVRESPTDVVLTDLRLPGLDGLELVRRLRADHPRLPIILMTAHGTTQTAIEAMQLGAFDYLLKPFELPELIDLLRRAATAARQMTEAVSLGEAREDKRSALVGQSRLMQAVYKEIGRLAKRPLTILLRGETGTGKELVARALYQHSDRSDRPFVAVNCGAIPETLLESELFGHERGAFTGADQRRIGRFEQASGGTLFLDEVGDLSPVTQVKLLRVLQERIVQRLGGREDIPVDVRVIAATHADLEDLRREGKFREDLYYRLAVAVIHLPPLRDRLEDLPALVDYFARKHGPDLGCPAPIVPPDTLRRLQEHDWPGNVRELENVVRKAILEAQGFPVLPSHVAAALGRPEAQLPAAETPDGSLAQLAANLLNQAEAGQITNARDRLVQAAEQVLIPLALKRAGGNQARAARWLGITRWTLREKLRQWERPPHPPEAP